MKTRRTSVLLFVLLVTTVLVTTVLVTTVQLFAQGQDPRRRRPGGERPERPPTEESKSAKPASDGKITAIVGGDVYTVTHEVIRRGTVLIQGEKILRVGQGIEIPAGATVIDAKGKWVTPGFVALDMSRIALNASGERTNRTSDSLDPFDRNIKLALGIGITSGCVDTSSRSGFQGRRAETVDRFLGFEPELPLEVLLDEEHASHAHDGVSDEECDTCPCCGLPIIPLEPIGPSRFSQAGPRRYSVLKMSYGELEPMLIDKPTFYNPGPGAFSGALNIYNWRQNVERARKYVAEQAEHEKAIRAGQRVNPPRKPVSDEMISLVKKEVSLRVRADSIDDIHNMIALAKELDYKLVLDGVAEGWLVAKELSEAEVPVVITPRRRRLPQPGRETSSGSSIEAPGIFEKSGVHFALAALSDSISLDGLPGRDLTSLPLEAAFAVRGGCSEATALAALTIVPAQLLGMGDRVGSIEEGKDADLLVLNGPPLDYRTYVETALVSGHVCYERAKDRVYPVFER